MKTYLIFKTHIQLLVLDLIYLLLGTIIFWFERFYEECTIFLGFIT